MRHWFAALLLLVLFVLLLPASRAEAAARLHGPSGTVLRPGDVVELRWVGLDPGAREVELELSLDGSRWVRISPELHALEGRWEWRVPAVSAEHARLRLRCGGEHREEVAAIGADFRIASPGSLSGAERRDFLGEWWPALDTRTYGAVRSGLRDGDRAVLANVTGHPETDVPAAPSLDVPHDDGVLLSAGDDDVLPPPSEGHARSARPVFVPLLN